MKLVRFLDERGEEVFLVALIAVSVTVLFVQVVLRYVFNNSLSWSEELARYMFLWMIWIGASMAARKSRHLRAEFITNFLPKRLHKPLEFLAMALWLGFSLWLTWTSIGLTRSIYLAKQVSAAMQMPMYIPYASVPVGCGLMSIRIIQNMALLFKSSKEV